MELILDEQGHAVLKDGKPVYRHSDGKELIFDAAQAFNKIGSLTGENTAYKKRFEEAESKLKTFEGITDPSAAMKALETVSSLDSKKLIDAGEVDKVKAEISKGYEAKLTEATTKAQALEQQLYSEKIGGSFARSKMIANKLAIPSDLVQARFGPAFKIEEGRTVAYDPSGNKIYSRTKPGELADFEEALETLIDQYPYVESILKGSGASGGGASTSTQSSPGNKVIKLSDLNAMRPKDRAAAMSSGAKVID